jgi:hypothetical protein
VDAKLVIPITLGVALHLYTAAFEVEGGASAFLLGLVVFSVLPYAVAALLPRLRVSRVAASGYAFGALAGDAFMHYSAFVAPKGSTAALGLLFMPLWNLLLVGPAAALIAWGVAVRFGARRAERKSSPTEPRRPR